MKHTLVAKVSDDGAVMISGHGDLAHQDKQLRALAIEVLRLLTQRIAVGTELTGIDRIDELQQRLRVAQNTIVQTDKALRRRD